MKAIVYSRYGAPDVLQLQEMPKPSPKPGEILIKIHATSVNSADCRLRRADPWAIRLIFGLLRPRKPILGEVFSGEIEAVGSGVTRFLPGQPVFGSTGLAFGAYAEYVCLPETAPVAVKPDGWSYADAAAMPFGATTALHFLQKANVQPGQHVLVYGASGAVGSAAVQLARVMGATVTAVCSGANADLVRSIGAAHVIDYTREKFWESGRQYDLIFEAVNKAPVRGCLTALRPGGTLILGAAMLGEMLAAKWGALTTGKNVLFGPTAATLEQIGFLQQQMATGALRPVVDRLYSLAQMAEAHAYVDQGHKKGSVIVTMAPSGTITTTRASHTERIHVTG